MNVGLSLLEKRNFTKRFQYRLMQNVSGSSGRSLLAPQVIVRILWRAAHGLQSAHHGGAHRLQGLDESNAAAEHMVYHFGVTGPRRIY